ncbi:MAG: hypothetical protein JO281_06500 [Pseudonocardiales bacterium]|nr:hypothetical protein [Pseudonocardiales bacterium]
MSETPIYDQLRGERINADVPATRADPQRVGRPGERCLPSGAARVSTAFDRPPGTGAGLAANRPAAVAALVTENAAPRVEPATGTRLGGQTYPVGQLAGYDRETAAVWGPRAALPPTIHARKAQPQRGSGSDARHRPQPDHCQQ